MSARSQRRRPEQTRAIAAIKSWGGRVESDQKSPDQPAVKVDLSFTNVTDAGLEQLQALVSIQALYPVGTHVSDAGLHHLRSLTSLEDLALGGTSVTGTGLGLLNRLTKLRRLSLVRTQVTDAGPRTPRGSALTCWPSRYKARKEIIGKR